MVRYMSPMFLHMVSSRVWLHLFGTGLFRDLVKNVFSIGFDLWIRVSRIWITSQEKVRRVLLCSRLKMRGGFHLIPWATVFDECSYWFGNGHGIQRHIA